MFSCAKEVLTATAKRIALKNQQQEQLLRCNSCTLPILCLESVIIPVFCSFFSRQFVSEELYCGCDPYRCLFTVILPEPLTENKENLLQRKLERQLAKIMGRTFNDIVRMKLVFITHNKVIIRM